MTSGRLLLRGAILSTGGMLLSMAGAMVVGIIYTHVLSESLVGIFALLIFSVDLFLLLNNAGLYSALPKLVAAEPEEQHALSLSSILGIQLVVSCILGLILLLGWSLLPSPRLISANPSWLRLFPYLWLLPPLAVVATQRDTALGAAAGIGHYGARAAALAAGSAVQILLAVLCLWWMKGGFYALALGTLASYAVAAGGLAACLPGKGQLSLHWKPYREAVAFSWPLYANNLFGFIYQRLDTVIIAALMGTAIAAYFEMAKKLPIMLSRLLVTTLTPYLPGISTRIAAGDIEGAARLVNRTARLMAVIVYTSVLAMAALRKPILQIVYPSGYLAAADVLVLLLVTTGMAIITSLMGMGLIAIGKPGLVTTANIALACVSTLGNILLIPHFGMMGAGIASLAAIVLSGIAQTALLHRQGILVDIRSLILPHALLAGCLGIIYTASDNLCFAILAPIAYATGSIALGCINLHEIRELTRAAGLARLLTAIRR